ncbi:DUF6188 family protein [Streptosporangium carneum]|uniref:Uncharacterized protein n=1 Tax=Streptosporangium carneum TaxID=47481 RepID=A0A9W6MER9_9ACTN|nr:DUF6188 family protein [Streptosporangium carneum]GLK11427.1 hypothetical protein GCM10017600_48340 [Streptosporangium carneum]
MKLNEKAAARIAEEQLDRWRRVARYDELAVMKENGDKDWKNVTGEDGQEYKVLAYVLPYGDETLRMVVSVNHLRRDHAAADPLIREAVMRSDGTVTTPADLAELEDRWILPYRGMQVVQVRVSYQLTLLLDGDAQVNIESAATLTRGPLSAPDAEPVQLTPERQEVAPALVLFGATLVSSVAFKSGALRLVFDTGTHLNVKPDSQYEAWSTCGPDDLRFVCLPGGGLSIFR